MANTLITPAVEQIWHHFSVRHALTPYQLDQFKQYYALLVQTNDIHNLTAITNLEEIIFYHFDDSLALGSTLTQYSIKTFADVGTGGGFPGIPLKIVYPQLHVILIEVTHKKIEFLHTVMQMLHLKDIVTTDLDWRTFLRKTDYPLDLIGARASLQPAQLVRMFKPSSAYRAATLVYWASQSWQPTPVETPYIDHELSYRVGTKSRRLVFFKDKVIGT